MCVRVRVCRSRCPAEQGDGLHLVVMLCEIAPSLRGVDGLWTLRKRERVAKQLRVDAKYERGIDGLAHAADLGRELVQGIKMFQDVIERALGDVLPFILYI